MNVNSELKLVKSPAITASEEKRDTNISKTYYLLDWEFHKL